MIQAKDETTYPRAAELLMYDPETGSFYWRVSRGRVKAGSEAGVVHGDGHRGTPYLKIKIDGQQCRAHRLAWLLMTGRWPTDQIDHISGDSLDNRWANLREATQLENNRNCRIQANNKSGFRGIHWRSRRSKWEVRIRHDGRRYGCGLFENLEDAILARLEAEREFWGFHPTNDAA